TLSPSRGVVRGRGDDYPAWARSTPNGDRSHARSAESMCETFAPDGAADDSVALRLVTEEDSADEDAVADDELPVAHVILARLAGEDLVAVEDADRFHRQANPLRDRYRRVRRVESLGADGVGGRHLRLRDGDQPEAVDDAVQRPLTPFVYPDFTQESVSAAVAEVTERPFWATPTRLVIVTGSIFSTSREWQSSS